MIQHLFLFISWWTSPSLSNDIPDEDDDDIFTNLSFKYDISDDVPTVDTDKLTDDIIDQVPIVILQRHNHIRRHYGLPILRLSVKLNILCEMHAEEHASGKKSLLIDYPLEYGINVYYGTRVASNPNHVMELWINESLFYSSKSSNEENINKMPHLSQILWKDTEAIGVYITVIDYLLTETFLLYILYDPPGNSVEGFKDNVPPLDFNNLGTISHKKTLCHFNTFLLVAQILKLLP